MKITALRNKWIVMLMIAGLGLSVKAVAHDQIGTLGVEGNATDYYLVTCSSDAGGVTDYLEVQIYDATVEQGGGKMSAVILREPVASTASDPYRADEFQNHDKNPGPPAFVGGGDGVYKVMVHKLKDGPKNYLLSYHCKSSVGLHTGTSILILQDQ
ncbi:hypothetical protein [Nitrosococcus watsonii]|uniref:Uncharacterized protein n=1 Tax=Nitrosococcus watsoni (strain C-113) TaxID=105559 RepID=D8K566_NITWC|nr:hypothetical protein [Nitrosococcus watsonii]ADJ28043.1 conserved hypothetical protein [Nitrosococcus watsonii C-113]